MTKPLDEAARLAVRICEQAQAERDCALELLRWSVAYIERENGHMPPEDQMRLWACRALLAEAAR